MKDAESLVRSYFTALAERDFEGVRTFLADKGFSYVSPIGHFDDADRFVENISALGPILESVTIRRLFVAGSEVMTLVDVVITMQGYATRTSANLFHIENDRIQHIEAIFDATEYHKMFAP